MSGPNALLGLESIAHLEGRWDDRERGVEETGRGSRDGVRGGFLGDSRAGRGREGEYKGGRGARR